MKKIELSEKNKTGVALVLCTALLCLIGFFCFYKLAVKYVDPWDEARHGVNAYEMLKEGSLFRNTYLYEPDYYNLKPPLSMWCQMISFFILGANSFSLRFYAALCYLILCAVCGRYMWKHYGRLEAVIALGLMAANTTPFAAHMVRAGDADSLYVLLFTLAMLFMMQIPKKQSNLIFCGLFFSLAFLTKSYHAGIIAVIGGLYLIVTGEIKKIKPKMWLGFIAACVVPILMWAVPRCMVDGLAFFKEMLLTDVLGRTDGTLQNNIQPFGWYAEYYLGTMSGKLMIYLWALIGIQAGCFICCVGRTKEELSARKNEIIAYCLWIFVPFVAFSAVSNKLLWYLYPVTVPLLLALAVMAAAVIRDKRIFLPLRTVAAVLVCLCICFYAKDVFATIQSQTAVAGNEFQNFIKDTAQKLRDEYGQETEIYGAVVYGVDETGAVQSEWAGQDVFVAEAYGDIICRQGGISYIAEQISQRTDQGVKLVFLAKDSEALLDTMDVALPEHFVKYAESEGYVVYEWR